VTGLFIQSLNALIGLHGMRLDVGIYSRLPITIFLALYFVAFLSMTLMGYQAGLTASRTPIASLALIMALTTVLMLVIDLDRGVQGIFDVSQRAIIDLSSRINPL
jgi:hypothetical protein